RLLSERQRPCVSIYCPTQKTYPKRQQDPVRYRNLVDRAEQMLREKHAAAEVAPILDHLRALADEGTFWIQGHAGVAILASPATFETFGLRNPPPERVMVADSFLLAPLLRVAQSADRFHVLCLQREA